MSRRLLFIVIAMAGTLVAFAMACSSFGENGVATASDGGGNDAVAIDDGDATGVRPTNDAGDINDAGASTCPTTGCGPQPDGSTCDNFDRADLLVGWGSVGSLADTEIVDGGCSGGVFHVGMPPHVANADESTKLIARSDQVDVLSQATVDFDILLMTDITAFTDTSFITLFAIAKDGEPSAGARYAGIAINKQASVAAITRNTDGITDITQSIPLPFGAWTHVKFIVAFSTTALGGRFAVYVNGQKAFDENVATLPANAGDVPGFTISLGVQASGDSPEVTVNYDNFQIAISQ